jgi:hypothetical protein
MKSNRGDGDLLLIHRRRDPGELRSDADPDAINSIGAEIETIIKAGR